jgi:hypothetical protein
LVLSVRTMTNTTKELVTAEMVSGESILRFESVYTELQVTRDLLRAAVAKLNRRDRKALVTERVEAVEHWTKMEAGEVRSAWLPFKQADLALAMNVIGRPENL